MEAVHEAVVREVNGCVSTKTDKTEDCNGGEEGKLEDFSDGEEENETQSLLQPQRKPERKPERSRRRVSWSDLRGNQLTEVLIYEPCDGGDSDEETADSCFCTKMYAKVKKAIF